jgi:hypothetical protein
MKDVRRLRLRALRRDVLNRQTIEIANSVWKVLA